MSKTDVTDLRTLYWEGDVHGTLIMIDQTKLPLEFVEITCETIEKVWEAIKVLRVRGAPAIGIAAAYGVCVGIQKSLELEKEAFFQKILASCEYLATSRPTAVNLFWALDRMKSVAEEVRESENAVIAERLLREAKEIEQADKEICRELGRLGAELLNSGSGVLTHCNAGGLATADYGTALAVFFSAHEQGKEIEVFADETRPLLQGARLTSWELQQRGIPVTVICDSAAAHVMSEGKIQAVVTGADRVASNGDAANKIGTYSVALAAKAHNIPFYIVAPTSTFDMSLESGKEIPIEERDPTEITNGFGKQTAPHEVNAYNPAFDVTPAELITALICEKGVIDPVTKENVAKVVNS